LLRHAHAMQAVPGQDDMERPLSRTGQVEAWTAGAWLAAQKCVADRVLCSPARRTRETLDAVLRSTGPLPVRLEPEIYEADVGVLAGLVDAHRDVPRLWLVGHNPGLEQLVALLSQGRSGDYRGMPPGAVAMLRLPKDAAIEPGVAEVVNFWWP